MYYSYYQHVILDGCMTANVNAKQIVSCWNKQYHNNNIQPSKAVIFLDPDLETYAEMVILFFFCVPFFSGFLG